MQAGQFNEAEALMHQLLLHVETVKVCCLTLSQFALLLCGCHSGVNMHVLKAVMFPKKCFQTWARYLFKPSRTLLQSFARDLACQTLPCCANAPVIQLHRGGIYA